MSQLTAVDAGQVTAIAAEVLAAMVDGQTGLVTSWPGGPVTAVNPLYAWVNLSSEPVGRVLLTADAGTAEDLTRAFLRNVVTDPVADCDVADAFGEIANILGGNIKALFSEPVRLTLPQVSRQPPAAAGGVRLLEVPLAWRGRRLVISLWTI